MGISTKACTTTMAGTAGRTSGLPSVGRTAAGRSTAASLPGATAPGRAIAAGLPGTTTPAPTGAAALGCAPASRGVSRREFLGLAGVFGLGASLALFVEPRAAQADDAIQVKICVNNSARPFCYIDTDGTTITGYDVDSLKLCEEKLGGKYAFTFEAMEFNTVISSLQSGACEMVSTLLVPNDDRREKFLFPTEPYVLAPMILITRKDSGITSLEDMAGKKIAQNPVNYEYGMLVAYNEQNPDLAMEIVEYNSTTQADLARMVANGQVDASLIYESMFEDYKAAGGVELGKTDVVLTESCYYMLSRDQQELADDLDAALKEAKEDGTLSELSVRWLGEDVFEKYADVLSDNQLLAGAASDDDGEVAGAASSASDGGAASSSEADA